MVRSGILTSVVAFALLHSGNAHAQTQIDPSVARQIPRQLEAIITPRDLRRQIAGPNGEAATGWVSPLLLNHPGTIGGERYTINGDAYLYEFGFSIINPSRDANATGGLDCFREDGSVDSKYATRFEIPPMNAMQWRSDRAVPTATADGRADEDRVWCHIWTDRPVYAFGVRYTEAGSDRNDAGFDLLAAAR